MSLQVKLYWDVSAAEVLHMDATPLAFIELLLSLGDGVVPNQEKKINQVQSVSLVGGDKRSWHGLWLQLILSHLVVYMILLVLRVWN